ncbi:MAG: hypothetical protein LV477_01680 [Candidatus Nitrosotalea sp.]|nr:hypothetical protein [Candidatus Nitrosotalea sp.]
MAVMDEEPTPRFEPSMKLLSRIMKVILEKNSVGKTMLSQESNVQYARLLKHLEWLEKRHFIESVVDDGKIGFKFTTLGKNFATMISLQ